MGGTAERRTGGAAERRTGGPGAFARGYPVGSLLQRSLRLHPSAVPPFRRSAAFFSPGRMQRPQQMRQPHLQIGEQRQVGAGAGDLLEVERRRDQRLLEDRPSRDHVAPRGPPRSIRREMPCRPRTRPAAPARRRRRARSAMSWTMRLQRPRLAGRPAPLSSPGTDAARGAGAGHDDELGAVERREHRREGVPGVLADQDRRPAPAACRTPGRSGRPRRSAPRRRRRRSAGTPCGGRGGSRRRVRPAWRTAPEL